MSKKWVYLIIDVYYGGVLAFGKKKDALQYLFDEGYTEQNSDQPDEYYQPEGSDNYYRLQKERIR